MINDLSLHCRVAAVVLLSLGLLLPGRLPAQTPEEGKQVLSGFEHPIAEEWMFSADQPDMVPFTDDSTEGKVKEGAASGRWEVARRPWASLKQVPEDWTPYAALTVWIYSEKASNQPILFWVYSHGADGQGYYYQKVDVDWTGWKRMVLPLDSFEARRSPEGWNHITGMMISAKSADVTPQPDVVLWLDDMKLESL